MLVQYPLTLVICWDALLLVADFRSLGTYTWITIVVLKVDLTKKSVSYGDVANLK